VLAVFSMGFLAFCGYNHRFIGLMAL